MKSIALVLAVALAFAAGWYFGPRDSAAAQAAGSTADSQLEPIRSAPVPPADQPSMLARDNVPIPDLPYDQRQKLDLNYAKPTREHAELRPLIGSWNIDIEVMNPGHATQRSTARSTIATRLEGRFLEESMRGTLVGQPYEAIGLLGFDIMAREFIMNWSDSFGTATHFSRGSRDSDGAVVLRGVKRDPLRPRGYEFKTEIRWTFEADETVQKMERKVYESIEDREVLVMTMRYTRAG